MHASLFKDYPYFMTERLKLAGILNQQRSSSYRTLLSSIIFGYIPVCKMQAIIYYLKTHWLLFIGEF